jgi:membrane protease subunit HflK
MDAIGDIMAWNDSGNQGGDNDPWGNKRRNQGPPDLDKIIKQWITQLKKQLGFKTRAHAFGKGQSSMGSGGMKAGLSLLIAIVVIAWAVAGFFIVRPAEQAVVLRFGKFDKVVNPGPHWVPYFIDRYYKVNVQKMNQFDFRLEILTQSEDKHRTTAKVVRVVETSEVDADTDKNVVDVEVGVQYRIGDPEKYLFNMTNPEQMLEQTASAVLSEVVGKMNLTDVLTVGRDKIESREQEELQALMDKYGTGIDIAIVTVRKSEAPEQVRDAFNDVQTAGQDEERYKQIAEAYERKVVPIAKGEAKRTIARGQAYKQAVVLDAQANVASYLALLGVYQSAPEVTKKRLYIDTMRSVLSHTTLRIIDVKNSNNLLYLPMGPMLGGQSNAARAALSGDGHDESNDNGDETATEGVYREPVVSRGSHRYADGSGY